MAGTGATDAALRAAVERGEVAGVAATSGSTARDALGDTTVAGLRESLDGEQVAGAITTDRGAAETGRQEFLSGDRPTRSLPIVRPGAGIGPVERLPGEDDTSALPSLAPDRELTPDFGPQP